MDQDRFDQLARALGGTSSRQTSRDASLARTKRRRRRGGATDGATDADASTTAAAGTPHFGIAGGGAIITNQVQPVQPFRARQTGLLPIHDQTGRLVGYAPVHALGAEPPSALGQPCAAAAQQLCITPGAVCTAYTGAGAPGGTFCSLPLQKVCTGDPDCTCYTCWYTQATVTGQGLGRSRDGRSSSNVRACCQVAGNTCTGDQDCCLGLSCVGGRCAGQLCTPDDTSGCGPAAPCCNEGNGASCQAGICETCGPATCPNGCCQAGQCVPYASQAAATCGEAGAACAACPTPTNQCKEATCSSAGVCGEANKAANAACDYNAGTGNGFCNGSGTCVECTAVGQCTNTVTDCENRACTAGVCGATDKANGTTCSSGGGTLCANGVCSACDATSCPDGCCDNSGACDKSGQACPGAGGVCGTPCSGNQRCAASTCEVCDVCTDGSCAYTSIKAAYEAKPTGSTIRIAPGTYTEGTISQYGVNTTGAEALKNMTLQRCGDYGTVLWQNTIGGGGALVSMNIGDSSAPAAPSPTLTFVHLDFNVRQDPNIFFMDGAFKIQGYRSNAGPGSPTRAKIVLKHCRFDGQTLTPILATEFTDVLVEDTTFANGTMRNGHYGGIVSVGNSPSYPNNTVVVKRSTFTDNASPACPGAIKMMLGQLTLEDTTLSGNSCTAPNTVFLIDSLGGAGVFADMYSTVTMTNATGTTAVTENVLTGPGGGSGVLVEARAGAAAPSRLTGVTSAKVYDNDPAAQDCAIATVSGGGYAAHPVDCDDWCVPAGTSIDARSCSLCCGGSCSGGVCT